MDVLLVCGSWTLGLTLLLTVIVKMAKQRCNRMRAREPELPRDLPRELVEWLLRGSELVRRAFSDADDDGGDSTNDDGESSRSCSDSDVSEIRSDESVACSLFHLVSENRIQLISSVVSIVLH